MIRAAATACLVLCVNCAYAAVARAASKRSGIDLSFRNGAGSLLWWTGGAFEAAALLHHTDVRATPMLIVALGAVVTGAACDAACGYVFDAITLPTLAILLASAAVSHTLAPFALGVASAGGTLAVLYVLTRGRGLGGGDVKLACCIGGAIGAVGGIEALGIAFVAGGAYASVLLATRRARRNDEIRFAPYLALGMLTIVLSGAGA